MAIVHISYLCIKNDRRIQNLHTRQSIKDKQSYTYFTLIFKSGFSFDSSWRRYYYTRSKTLKFRVKIG